MSLIRMAELLDSVAKPLVDLYQFGLNHDYESMTIAKEQWAGAKTMFRLMAMEQGVTEQGVDGMIQLVEDHYAIWNW